MEKIGYIPFIILAVIGFILIGSKPVSHELESIDYRYNNQPTTSVITNTKYVLSVGNSHNYTREIGDTLFWTITDPEGKSKGLYALSPVFTFGEMGDYTIDTYQLNGKLLATDSISVSETEFLAFELASDILIEGDDEIAYNKSTYRDRIREWVIEDSDGEEQMRDSRSDTLLMDLIPGDYFVVLQLYNDFDTIQERKELTVKKYVASKPVSKPKPRKTNTPYVPASKPVSKPAPPAEKSPEGWYKATTSTSEFSLGPVVPSKNNSFSGGTVIIELSPKIDLQLSSFSFWGNHNTGNYSIVYECTTCANENEKRLNPFVYRTGNDFYEPQTRRLDSKRIGFKAGHTYKLTFVTQENTQMQFDKLSKTKYENSNLTMEFITDRSAIFGLIFKTK